MNLKIIRVWGIPLFHLGLPFLSVLSIIFSGHALSFPFSDTGPAFEIFPKLLSEYNTLRDVYSTETAKNYVLSYSNSFILGAILTIGGFIVELFIRTRFYWRSSSRTAGVKKTKLMDYQVKMQREKAFICAIALLLALLCFAFLVPLSFFPTPGVSKSRLLNSLYGGIFFAFPSIFTLIYFLSLAGLNLLYPDMNPDNSTSQEN